MLPLHLESSLSMGLMINTSRSKSAICIFLLPKKRLASELTPRIDDTSYSNPFAYCSVLHRQTFLLPSQDQPKLLTTSMIVTSVVKPVS